MLTIQEALKHFGPEGGSVINISSIASFNPTQNSLVYAATKKCLGLDHARACEGVGAQEDPGQLDRSGRRRD